MLSIEVNEVWFQVSITRTATAPVQRHDTESGSYNRVTADQKIKLNAIGFIKNGEEMFDMSRPDLCLPVSVDITSTH